MSRNGRRIDVRRALAAACVALVVLGCSAGDDDESRSDASPVDSGVGVVAEGCGLTARVGSGVVVASGADAVVVTVAHTIKGATELRVVDADGSEHQARLVAFDKDTDLAALDVEGTSLPPLDVAADLVTPAGDAPGALLTWSRDSGVERVPITIVKRLLVTIEDIYIDDVVERTALEIAGPVRVGDSGGPVLDADGDVAGIVYANSRGRADVGFATDRDELTALLDSIDGRSVDSGTCF